MRAISAEVSAGDSVEITAADDATRVSGVVTIRLPARLSSIAILGRPVAGAGVADVTVTDAGAGAGRVVTVRGGAPQLGNSNVQAAHRQTNARPRSRRMWPC